MTDAAEAWDAEMITQAFAQKVVARLLKCSLIHVSFVRFHLGINLGVYQLELTG